MPNYTLLTVVQDILTGITTESVASIESGSTTEEALRVVNLINREYESLLNKVKWKHLKSFKSLIAGTNLNQLKGDIGDSYIKWDTVRYGSINQEKLICYIEPEEFMRRTVGRNSTDTNITVIDGKKIWNDRNPSFYTTFDDVELTFDAIPTGSGLVPADSSAYITTHPTIRLSLDIDTLNLPIQVQPYFRDLCLGYALEEIAFEDTKGLAKKRDANNQIMKIARSGNMIEKEEDLYKYIITRRGSYLPTNITNWREI